MNVKNIQYKNYRHYNANADLMRKCKIIYYYTASVNYIDFDHFILFSSVQTEHKLTQINEKYKNNKL